MPKQTDLTVTLEPELRAEFFAAADAAHQAPAEVVRGLVREFVERQRGYDSFLRRKVEIARAEIDAGLHYSDDEIEAEADARIAELECEAAQAKA